MLLTSFFIFDQIEERTTGLFLNFYRHDSDMLQLYHKQLITKPKDRSWVFIVESNP
jgi:hypothetical protein